MKKEELSYRKCGCLSDSYKECIHQRLQCPNGCEYLIEACNECPKYVEETENTGSF